MKGRANTLKVVKRPGRKPPRKRDPEDVVWTTPLELTAEEMIRFELHRQFLLENKHWKPIFTSILATYIRTESIMAMAGNKIRSEADLIQRFRNGVTNVSPELSAFLKTLDKLNTLAGELGATPRTIKALDSSPGAQLNMFESPLHQRFRT